MLAEEKGRKKRQKRCKIESCLKHYPIVVDVVVAVDAVVLVAVNVIAFARAIAVVLNLAEREREGEKF